MSSENTVSWITEVDVDFDIVRPFQQLLADVLVEAREYYNADAMAFYLMVANLSFIVQNAPIEARMGDRDGGQPWGFSRFEIGDTSIYVNLDPSLTVIEHCQASVRDSKRVLLLVRSGMLEAARQLLWLRGVAHEVGVYPLETYLSLSLEIRARFGSNQLRVVFHEFVGRYNDLVLSAEISGAPCIELPPDYLSS